MRKINENITKTDVNSIIQTKINDFVKSKELEKRVRELTSDVISELLKSLWQRDNMWKSSIRK
jgi:hypothetical protein